MTGLLCSIALAAGAGVPADPVAARDLTGTWLVAGGEARVEVLPCGGQLCGRIVWLEDPAAPTGGEKLDVHNPDPRLRERRILGLEVLRVSPATSGGNRTWSGTIYDPHNGKTYRCKVELLRDGRLKIRGYFGFSLFGRTTYWMRVPPATESTGSRAGSPSVAAAAGVV
jgi:uncharacterized protein (DUF2147 family)